ncbi:uncharacterized protein CC84DRAFT_279918 [Paraphaeosphaeria sporulosa]|uniref:Uncharacterized protein n=1 Tax=Paraphaeosphaeria sporulosa TaxID=1460663 RepID=A0A177C349_9PLEO|nr:uncharacterized protein CC84DRAFT_279918 [Paraphaeosphaeria sporulosa]OAG01197.1 hypothetical protein CC84DRAFT_279918 [Paraphaeosphaeria sporulosa]
MFELSTNRRETLTVKALLAATGATFNASVSGLSRKCKTRTGRVCSGCNSLCSPSGGRNALAFPHSYHRTGVDCPNSCRAVTRVSLATSTSYCQDQTAFVFSRSIALSLIRLSARFKKSLTLIDATKRYHTFGARKRSPSKRSLSIPRVLVGVNTLDDKPQERSFRPQELRRTRIQDVSDRPDRHQSRRRGQESTGRIDGQDLSACNEGDCFTQAWPP